MWWQYFLVLIGTFAVDVVPIPLPPAFTVMIFLQIYFDLNIWAVIGLGVSGSIIGRFILALYTPYLSAKFFKRSKNKDMHFLGEKIKENGWRSHVTIFVYSLMPLPTTPLFLTAGMAQLGPFFVFPGFILGKLISDSTAMLLGKYAAENAADLLHGIVSLKSIAGLVCGLLLVFALLFIDWQTLLIHKKLRLGFSIFNKGAKKL